MLVSFLSGYRAEAIRGDVDCMHVSWVLQARCEGIYVRLEGSCLLIEAALGQLCCRWADVIAVHGHERPYTVESTRYMGKHHRFMANVAHACTISSHV